MTVNDGIQVDDAKVCFLCHTSGAARYHGMRDKIHGVAGIWTINYCKRCEFCWLDPRPAPSEIAKLYKTYHTHTLELTKRSILSSLKHKVESRLLSSEYGYASIQGGTGSRIVGKFISAFVPMAKEMAGSAVMWLDAKPGGQLLDVGCGNGSFIATMQRLGWKVLGVEPDAKSASIAREQYGVPVVTKALEDVRFPPRSFDCVTSHQTIEHMYEPIAFLKESLRILKPGGRLVITTPNVPSLGHRLFRRCWRGLEPPRHFYLFSPQALRKSVEKVGFHIDVLRTTARSAWEIWYASRLIRRDGKIPENFRQRLNIRLRLEGMVYQLVQHFLLRLNSGLGEQIVLIASKSSSEGND